MSTSMPANGIFFTEEELRDQYKKRLKGPDGGGRNWYTDRIKGGITRDEDGNIQRSGAAWWLQGLEADGFAETAADRNKDLAEADFIQTQIESTGANLDKLEETLKGRKLTKNNVGSFIRATNRALEREPSAIEAAKIQQLEANSTLASQTLAAQTAHNALTLQLAQTNAASNKELALLTRADNMDARRADLEFRRDQMMLLDKQYNDKLALDSKDRKRENMMTLFAGLTNMNGLFLS